MVSPLPMFTKVKPRRSTLVHRLLSLGRVCLIFGAIVLIFRWLQGLHEKHPSLYQHARQPSVGTVLARSTKRQSVLEVDDERDLDEDDPDDIGPGRISQLNVHTSDHDDAAAMNRPAIGGNAFPSAFPPYEEYAALISRAGSLPDLIFIPFEEAVSEDTLQGWEYEWIANGTYNGQKWGPLPEPKIDFVYTWVNGSDNRFVQTRRPYEFNSSLNDRGGNWLKKHGESRYRDWDELRYSVRSIQANAIFRNKIRILVNAVVSDQHGHTQRQTPSWLKDANPDEETIQILSQEDFFEHDKQGCLPSFNSLTIENQIHNIESDVDQLFALSDDMLLGKPHAASDMFSPLFGHMMGFKTNAYNVRSRPTDEDAHRFGEKPWLIYTSWLLNRRFGMRKRRGQVHFGHSLSRRVMRETMTSFPGPELLSACSRFRGDFQFQLYSWYATFHYLMERHREVLLWSYIMVRADVDGDGLLSSAERSQVIADVEEGLANEAISSYRARNFYHVADILEGAGLQPPNVNLDILWTSSDGPVMTKDVDCEGFDVNECLAPGFSLEGRDTSPTFSTAAIFDRTARQMPECGDCLLKVLLHRTKAGMSPLLPLKETQPEALETVIKALVRYQYTITNPDGLFVMVTDAEQVESQLIKRFKKKTRWVGQLCLNDDVATEEEDSLADVKAAITDMFLDLFPDPSPYEVT